MDDRAVISSMSQYRSVQILPSRLLQARKPTSQAPRCLCRCHPRRCAIRMRELKRSKGDIEALVEVIFHYHQRPVYPGYHQRPGYPRYHQRPGHPHCQQPPGRPIRREENGGTLQRDRLKPDEQSGQNAWPVEEAVVMEKAGACARRDNSRLISLNIYQIAQCVRPTRNTSPKERVSVW